MPCSLRRGSLMSVRGSASETNRSRLRGKGSVSPHCRQNRSTASSLALSSHISMPRSEASLHHPMMKSHDLLILRGRARRRAVQQRNDSTAPPTLIGPKQSDARPVFQAHLLGAKYAPVAPHPLACSQQSHEPLPQIAWMRKLAACREPAAQPAAAAYRVPGPTLQPLGSPAFDIPPAHRT